MKNINKKSINYSLKILTILAFGLLVLPMTVLADYNVSPFYVVGDQIFYSSGNGNTGYNSNQNSQNNNPLPYINSINPNYANIGSGAKTVTLIGGGFMQGSVARINGSNRNTTFLDPAHLLVQLTSNDLSQTNGISITVWNRAPGGGYSNAVPFTVRATVSNYNNTTTYTNTNNSYDNGYSTNYDYNSNYTNTTDTYSNSTQNQEDYNANQNANNGDNMSNLASNAVFGSNSFLPSGIVQWVLFGIFVLLIVILVRRIFGARDNYHSAPLKHA
jgi:hypothetical protein